MQDGGVEDKIGCEVARHDWKNLIRKGRASYECPQCHKDVMLELVLMAEAGIDITKLTY